MTVAPPLRCRHRRTPLTCPLCAWDRAFDAFGRLPLDERLRRYDARDPLAIDYYGPTIDPRRVGLVADVAGYL